MLSEPTATIGTQGRRMDGFEHEILRLVNHIRLATRIAAPEHIDEMFALRGECADGGISKSLPT